MLVNIRQWKVGLGYLGGSDGGNYYSSCLWSTLDAFWAGVQHISVYNIMYFVSLVFKGPVEFELGVRRWMKEVMPLYAQHSLQERNDKIGK